MQTSMKHFEKATLFLIYLTLPSYLEWCQYLALPSWGGSSRPVRIRSILSSSKTSSISTFLSSCNPSILLGWTRVARHGGELPVYLSLLLNLLLWQVQ